jgi:hypothetical protein
MGIRGTFFLGLAAAILLSATATYAQDEPSLGDLARQQRQQKEKSKTAHDKEKDAKAPKVITNEEIPVHPSTPAATSDSGTPTAVASDGDKQLNEGDVKSQIQTQRSQIASLQKQIEQIQESIKFAPANCVSGCEQWNERQRQKQEQVERMQVQLEELKKSLEEQQEAARKQGLGSSVYDP